MSQVQIRLDQIAKTLEKYVLKLTEIPLIPIICLLSMCIHPSVWPVIIPAALHAQQTEDI